MTEIKPVTSPWPLNRIKDNGREGKKHEYQKRQPKKTDPAQGDAKDHLIDEYA